MQSSDSTRKLHIGKPAWLKSKIPGGEKFLKIKKDLREKKLFTVCEEAKCPNISECWNHGTATFMVLGDTCTRACRFCSVKTGNPGGLLDGDEPRKVAESAAIMGIDYAVITMVDRDDLPDGGAVHLGKVVKEVRKSCPGINIELLTGDFHADENQISSVLAEAPEVFAHNLETVERLSPRVRDARASYRQSLDVLQKVKKLANYPVFTKSALMLGLGEEMDEVKKSLQDMRDHDVDFVTLGQYLRPTKQHLAIKRFVPPNEFDELADFSREIGFKAVASGPLVRSSYRAGEFYKQAVEQRSGE